MSSLQINKTSQDGKDGYTLNMREGDEVLSLTGRRTRRGVLDNQIEDSIMIGQHECMSY